MPRPSQIKSLFFHSLLALALLLPGSAKATEIENASSASPLAITFLDAEAAKIAILDDSLEPYFEFLQPMEMSAKTGSAITGATLEEQRKECRRRYGAGVREFTEQEKQAIGAYVKQIAPFLIEHYPLFGRTPWTFLKVSSQIEGGLPHTRGKCILFSESVCQNLARRKKSGLDTRRGSSTLNLLVHEQMHVFQRLNPGLLDPLYRDVWGFQKAKSIAGIDSDWFREHHLVNPDGVDCRWVLPIKSGEALSHVLPLLVLKEGEGPKHMPRDFLMIAVQLEKEGEAFRVKTGPEGRPVFRNLLQVPEYRAALPLSNNIYHPNEAAASYFASLAVLGYSAPEREPFPTADEGVKERLSNTVDWFKKNLQGK